MNENSNLTTESNFSNPVPPDKKPKGGLLLAILLGLLTFVVTGLLALVVIILFLPFGINLATILVAGFWGGYIVLQFALFILFALLGDFGTAVISWFINRSKKLASITFVSALIFQIIAIAVVIPATLKKSQETMNAGIAKEKSYTQYATINYVSVDPQEPFKFSYALNGKMTEVTLFKKLVFNIPVTVSQAGSYDVNVQYTSDSSFYANSDSSPNTKQILDIGNHVVKIEFVAGAAPNLGYELPSSVHGRALVQLDYLASKNELLDSMRSDNTVDQKVLQQFMKDEGLDQGASSNPTVNKFVGRKEVQF